MKKNLIIIISIVLLVACSQVPLTDRNRFAPLPSSQMLALGNQSYDAVLDSSQLSDNQRWENMITEVGNNMVYYIEGYFREKGEEETIEDFEWEFNLLESDQVNAWCMPGGKVAFYEGIMPICRDKNGVAVVMGHEIAHAIAQHSNERMGQQMITQLGGLSLAVAMSQKPKATQNLAMTAFGLGTQLAYVLPYSRKHESEADEMGLYFMAMAGYDVSEAPEFWKRMAANAKGQAPPEFLSTHPSHNTRISHLNKIIPKAEKFARKNEYVEAISSNSR